MPGKVNPGSPHHKAHYIAPLFPDDLCKPVDAKTHFTKARFDAVAISMSSSISKIRIFSSLR